MRKSIYIIMLAVATFLFASCNRNYYSGTKKGSNCGCPSL